MLRQAVDDSECSVEQKDFGINATAVAAAVRGPSLEFNRNSSGGQEKPDQRTAEEEATARIVEQLGAGLAKVLMAGFRVLQQQTTGALSDSVRRQQERVEAADKGLMDLRERTEQMTEAISEQKSVGLEAQDLSRLLNERIETLLSRMGKQQEELSAVQSAVSEITRKIAGAVERLDRQGEVISAIQQMQKPWETTIDQLVESLIRLKSSPNPPTAPRTRIGNVDIGAN
jgi:chromosome segregation ATPase